MKRILFAVLAVCALTLCSPLAWSQTSLPNLTYNASLNAACATPNAPCSGAVFTAVPTLVQTGQTGTALDVNSNNYAVATVTVSGTYSGATINFDFSDPSGGVSYFQVLCTRTDANIIEGSEVLPTNQIRSWQCPVFATYRFRVRVSAISSGSINTWITLTQSSIDPSPTEVNIEGNTIGQTDPCQNTQVMKSSVVINVSSATTTQLVALSGSTVVYACGFSVVATGTTPTVQFEYGTGASCGTGTTTLTGAYAPTAGSPLSYSNGGTIFKTPAGNALCVVTGGTPNAQGVLTFVQQ